MCLGTLLHGSNLNELRILLGEESVVKKERIIKIQEPIEINDSIKEETSSKISYNSLLDAPSEYYTINITTTNGIQAARDYLSSNNFDFSDVYLYEFGPEKKSTKIIYGIFSTVDEAKEALNKLPKSIIKNKPYIDSIKKHQKLFLKYN
jgi:adhesin transport system outer membrane protein